ncbi:hypothetical protein Tco_1581044, partial [Tanacetum coccineum]
MTHGTINSVLVQNIPSLTPAVPPTKNDWDSLFQPMFDEYFKPLPNVDHPVLEVPTPVLAASTSSHSSTTVDQDAPSTNFDELTAMASEHSNSGPALHEMTLATISSGLVPNPPPSTTVDLPEPEVIAPIDEVVALVPAVSTGSPSSTIVDQDAPSPIAHMGNDPYFGMPIPEIPSDQSSLSNSIHTIVHPDHQISEHNSKWTKDHPLE